MGWISLIIILSLAAITLVVRPLFRRREPWELVEGDSLQDQLGREKEKVLRLLKDLETEWGAGVISEIEYKDLRRSYRVEAAMLNRRLATLKRDIDGTSSRRAVPREATPADVPMAEGKDG